MIYIFIYILYIFDLNSYRILSNYSLKYLLLLLFVELKTQGLITILKLEMIIDVYYCTETLKRYLTYNPPNSNLVIDVQ